MSATETPPKDILAEGSILSAMLNQAVPVGEVKALLVPGDFYATKHQIIAKAIFDLDDMGHTADLVTVCTRLKDQGQLEAVEGSAYVTKILNDCPISTDYFRHARIVKAAATNRTIIENCNAAIRAATEGKDPLKVIAPLSANLGRLQDACEKPNRTGFKFVPAGELQSKRVDYLIHRLLESNSLVNIFGDPETLKSFLSIDFGCCIASGTDFHGHRIEKTGPVFYVCGEGRDGIGRRIKAWCIRNRVDMATLPLFVSTAPAGFTDQEQLVVVKAAIDQLSRDHGNPALIVVDTLARNFGPGDENSTKDMSAFVFALDVLRAAYNATVATVHHTGHLNKERGRGAMALRAAVDAEFRVTRDLDGIVRVEATKTKDAAPPAPMAFRPAVVELGAFDDDGQPITSLVLDEVEYTPPEAPQRTGHEGRGKWQRVAVEALQELYDQARGNLEAGGYNPDAARVTLDDWRDACRDAGLRHRSTWTRILNSLTDQGAVEVEHGFARPT